MQRAAQSERLKGRPRSPEVIARIVATKRAKPFACKYHGVLTEEAIGLKRRSITDATSTRCCKLCLRERDHSDTRKLKAQIVAGYGGSCSCCGATELEFLTIDHIHGRDGVKRERGLYRRLIREGFPSDELRLLCMNCNFSLGRYGYCPHKRLQLVVSQ